MGVSELTLEDSATWDQLVERLPEAMRDVHIRPAYFVPYEDTERKALCFVYEEDEGFAVYPFLRFRINSLPWTYLDEEYFDIEGVYGYNIFAVSSTAPGFYDRCRQAFLEYCARKNIVAEFMRVNVVLGSEFMFKHLMLQNVSQNIVIDLGLSEEDRWRSSYDHCVRKNVRKAQEAGMKVFFVNGQDVSDGLLDDFITIYYSTMNRRASGQQYYFSKAFLEKLFKGLGERCLLGFVCLPSGKPVSCEIVLCGSQVAYSFLGGALAEHNHLRPNNLLKHELIKELSSKGMRSYCLGGGKSPEDGIFRYKRTFSRNGVVDFFIGSRVHRNDVYRQLCDSWSEKFPDKVRGCGHLFLKYHS